MICWLAGASGVIDLKYLSEKLKKKSPSSPTNEYNSSVYYNMNYDIVPIKEYQWDRCRTYL